MSDLSKEQDTEIVVDHDRIERAVREILTAVGEDPDREGLLETPSRVARMYAEMSRVYELIHVFTCRKSLPKNTMKWYWFGTLASAACVSITYCLS